MTDGFILDCHVSQNKHQYCTMNFKCVTALKCTVNGHGDFTDYILYVTEIFTVQGDFHRIFSLPWDHQLY